MKYEVYCIINKINNKKYIGITIQGYKNRFKDHIKEAKANSDRYLCRAIRKYGENNFDIKVIDDKINDYTELLEKEKYYISILKTLIPNGYNMTLGGEGTLGRPVKEITREKIRLSKIGNIPWNKGKLNSQKGYWKGKNMPDTARKKMSLAKKGKKLSDETKTKRKYIYEKMKGENHPLYCVGHTEESIKKISENRKGKGTNKYRAYNNNEEIIFNSLKEALKFLGVKGHSSLIKAERNKTIYKNYYWEKLRQS